MQSIFRTICSYLNVGDKFCEMNDSLIKLILQNIDVDTKVQNQLLEISGFTFKNEKEAMILFRERFGEEISMKIIHIIRKNNVADTDNRLPPDQNYPLW